ncbi:MAG: hypothetical protein AB7P21_15760 [Lautropia sp.]
MAISEKPGELLAMNGSAKDPFEIKSAYSCPVSRSPVRNHPVQGPSFVNQEA